VLSEGDISPAQSTIRLRVAYGSAQALLTEYTASLSRGGCMLTARRPVEVGAVFRLEMVCTDGLSTEFVTPVVVEGEVVRVRPIYGAYLSYELAVRYRTTGAERPALESLLSRLRVDAGYAEVREHPRVPVNLLAEGSQGDGRRYFVRDVSRGGMRLHAQEIERDLTDGSRVVLGVRLCESTAPLVFLGGTVRWVRRLPEGGGSEVGVAFDDHDSFRPAQRMVLDELTRLVRPYQVFLHLGGTLPRSVTGKITFAARRRVAVTEVAAMLMEIAARDLPISLGLQVVEAPLHELLALRPACTARVEFSGDFVGGISLRASVELCAAIAQQITGDAVVLGDEPTLLDALREFTVGLGGGLCDRLEAVGYEVTLSAPVTEEASPAPRDDAEHRIALAGASGFAVLSLRIDAPLRGAPAPRSSLAFPAVR
jgi:hypothetical protein